MKVKPSRLSAASVTKKHSREFGFCLHTLCQTHGKIRCFVSHPIPKSFATPGFGPASWAARQTSLGQNWSCPKSVNCRLNSWRLKFCRPKTVAAIGNTPEPLTLGGLVFCDQPPSGWFQICWAYNISLDELQWPFCDHIGMMLSVRHPSKIKFYD